jgi:general secretion pathway protein D
MLGLLTSLGLALPVQAGTSPKKTSVTAESITLNFVNADIESVARTLATLSKRNVVVDPRVKGTINLTTEQAVSAAEAWNQFLAALRLQGFAMVQTQGLYKIVPEADAKLQGGAVQSIPSSANSGQIVTQIFSLKFEQANNLVAVLRPLISPNNTINVNAGNNALVITDYVDNLERLARIIAALDVANASDVEIIPLKYAIATDLAPLVTRLTEASNAPTTNANTPGTGSDYKTTILAEPRSNTLILRAANPARTALVRSLVSKLDQPGSESPSGNIHVVYLKNAEATKLAATLRAAISSDARSTTTPTASASPLATSAVPPTSGLGVTSVAMGTNTAASTSNNAAASTGGQIQADPATNSLIITAPEPQYKQLRAVIDMLDQRRAQVMVESLIAEVNADKALQMGIQWQNALGSKGGNVGVIGTNFNNGVTTSQGQGNILGIAAAGNSAVSAVGNGLNIGTVRNINGTYVLGSLATFLEQNSDGNILSTPTLLTLDNEEAKIVVGQNVPFVTGQYTNNNTVNGSVNPFQTIERKDVGLTLRIKPQISETGTVRLTIFQEVSSVSTDSVGSTAGLITNKRSIESSVLVDDGSIVVLGGLLSDTYSGTKSQVPSLGDVPGLGWLFKSESRSRNKSNLMVFLRPVVVRDAASAEALSNNRYQQMLGLQQQMQPSANLILNTDGSATLPPLPANASPRQPATQNAPAQ